MMPFSPNAWARLRRFTGLFLIAAALLCNEWTAPSLLGLTHPLYAADRVKLWCLALVLLAVGLPLFLKHRTLTRQAVLETLTQRYPRWGATVFGMFFALAALLLVETAFGIANYFHAKARPVQERLVGAARTYLDPTIGYRPVPLKRQVEVLRVNDKKVFEGAYTFDAYGRRVVPSSTDDRPKARAILVFGCSFAFGVGCNDNETLPHYLAEAAPNYKVYNFAYGGYGPQHVLALLDDTRLTAPITERREVIGIYVFIQPHVRRATLSMRLAQQPWARNSPCYQLRPGQWPLRLGLFPDAMPWTLAFYDLMAHEQILRFFDADLPFRESAADWDYTTKLLKFAENAFWSVFNSDRFYVLLHPVNQANMDEAAEYHTIFEKEKLKVLDYTRLFARDAAGYSIPGDGHPTPKSNRRLADEIVADLDLRFVETNATTEKPAR